MSKHRSGVDTTKRTDAEQAQRRMDELFRALIENASDIITILDAEGIIRYASPSVERLLGYKPHELIGTDIAELLHPADLSKSLESYAAMKEGVRSGTPEICQIAEERLRYKDGSWRILEGIAKVLDTPSGAGIVINSRDVTERKRTEEALRAGEEKHRTLFETMAQGVLYQNAEGHIVSANPAAERLLGLTLAEMLGRTSMDPRWKAIHEDGSHFPGDTHPGMIALKTGKEVSHVVMGVFHPGANEYVWIDIHAVPQFRPGETKPYQVYTTFDDITERKRAEEALRQSEENFEALAESASEGILIATGEEGRHVYANRRAVEITGYPIEELLKTCMRDLAHPDELPKLAERYKERLERLEVPKPYETAILNKDGIKVPIEISPSRTIWQNQLADMVMFRDITERKQAEEALRQSEQRFRRLSEATFEAIVIHDEGKVLDVNQTFAKMFGYEPSELIGKNMLDFTAPESRHLVLKNILSGYEEPYEVLALRKDGSTFVEETCGKTIPYGGRMVRVAAIRDLAERKRAERELHESEERYRSLVEAAPDVIYTVSAEDGSLTSLNPAFETLTGWSRAEWLGKPFVGMVHPDDLPVAEERFQKALRGETHPPHELRVLRKSGEYLVGEFTSTAHVKDGKVVAQLGIARDITERKRAEESMRQLSGRLLRSQDEERRRLARELHETTAQDLAGLAVNLNMVIDSAAHLSPRASACLSESLELAEQCSREIRTISYLLHPPLVDEAGLDPALRWYTAGFGQRSGIEVHVDVSPEFGRLPSEVELTLYRIVQEALTNIHRHSGSKTARICLERRPNEIVLTVADEGHGFPSAALGIAGPESADMGVGIPGMRERMRQLGGRLHIQSGRRGTTLTAILPLGQVTNGQITLPFGG